MGFSHNALWQGIIVVEVPVAPATCQNMEVVIQSRIQISLTNDINDDGLLMPLDPDSNTRWID